MGTQTVEITLERYEELGKKEALYELVMRDKDMNVYLYDVAAARVTEGGY